MNYKINIKNLNDEQIIKEFDLLYDKIKSDNALDKRKLDELMCAIDALYLSGTHQDFKNSLKDLI